MSKKHKDEADKVVRNIKRQTCRKFNAGEKIRIVLAGLRGEDSIAELCRREGIHQNLYYRWSLVNILNILRICKAIWQRLSKLNLGVTRRGDFTVLNTV